MSADGADIDEKFHRISGLLSGQIQWLSSFSFIPRGLIIRLQTWLKKFQEPTSNVIWKKQRNQYAYALYKHLEDAFYLLFEDTNPKNTFYLPTLLPPFDKLPPDGSLPNLPKHLMAFSNVTSISRIPPPRRYQTTVGLLVNDFFGRQVDEGSPSNTVDRKKYSKNLDLKNAVTGDGARGSQAAPPSSRLTCYPQSARPKSSARPQSARPGSSRPRSAAGVRFMSHGPEDPDDADSIDTLDALVFAENPYRPDSNNPGSLGLDNPSRVSESGRRSDGVNGEGGRVKGEEKGEEKEKQFILMAAATEKAADVATAAAERIAEK
eukprot:CAMPEP_0175039046 /NCGR_PEP_ID=MMETSP0052_2-20121109/289_1 /TAXON_ID=51329 ORGANISM="Polytomella parva, Strain SAG 63-3" /NCGR_SAMPLE_ID=MMETSP0052_2 /ASSEMBLY_ACC=CAM_ASM_000194 /LENGTH=320 /DNA_ID=CAMNT_0016300701 /DNA_START=36 /DNA_END=995 /DNA_ORIENTATION=-